jgi:hypothetical protein
MAPSSVKGVTTTISLAISMMPMAIGLSSLSGEVGVDDGVSRWLLQKLLSG